MRQLFGVANKLFTIALSFLGAIVAFSCKESIEKVDALSAVDSLSTQTVRKMEMIEAKFGRVYLSVEAPLMENYSLLPDPYRIFPNGIKVETFTPEGERETQITAQVAIHHTNSEQERWEVYNDVVIINHIKKERLETDTLYWDRASKRIYTHAHVKMFSPQGLMQGYGMESDEKAYDVTILRPFDSYGVIVRDTLASPPPSPMSPSIFPHLSIQ